MAALLVQKHSVKHHACSAPWRTCRAWGAARAAPRPSLHAASVKSPQELQLGVDIPINVKTVQVGERTFQLVVPCIDTVMEAYILAGQADRDPYWCDVWPSAVFMAEELLGRPELVAGKTVCEVGCGLGLAGLAAALSGAREVVLLDREPLALQCALMNAQLNGIPISLPSSEDASRGGLQPAALHCLAQQLALRGQYEAAPAAASSSEEAPALATAAAAAAAAAAEPAADPASSSNGSSSSSSSNNGGASQPPGVVRAEIFDWSQPVQVARSDVALACDVLYESFSVEPVARVVPQLLKRDSGRLLLADPPDRARHNRECFLDLLTEEGGREFVVEECGERQVRVWDEGKAEWRMTPVTLHSLRRTYAGDSVGVKAVRV